MSHTEPSNPPARSPGAAVPTTGADLGRLFRASLNQGRLHPLYLPMQQYRSGQATA